jgi:hypothetical protein
VLFVCAHERYEDLDLPDPAGKALEEARAIRDEIAVRIDRWLRTSVRAVKTSRILMQEP